MCIRDRHICHNMPHTHIVCIVHVYDDTHIQCICSCLVFNVCVLWSTPSITWSCSMEAFLNKKMVSCHSAPLMMMMYWSCSMVMLQPSSPASFGASQSMMQVCLRGQHQLTQGLDTRRHRANFKWKGNRIRSRVWTLCLYAGFVWPELDLKSRVWTVCMQVLFGQTLQCSSLEHCENLILSEILDLLGKLRFH